MSDFLTGGLARNFLAGSWVGGDKGASIAVEDPGNQDHVADCARAGEQSVGKALDAARASFERGDLPDMNPAEHGRLMIRIGQGIRNISDEGAEVPAVAVSILNGIGSDLGAKLVASWQVDQIVFTGSVPTGQRILRSTADNVIPSLMELGGKSAAVAFDDADLDTLMSSLQSGIFYYAGQVCSAMARVLVHRSVYDQAVELAASRVAQEEVFGPVTCFTPFDTEAEAVAMANGTEFGLVAGVFTRDLARAHRVARKLRAGQVFVNEWFAGGISTPFGVGKSGFGREKGLRRSITTSAPRTMRSR
ncbi:aldehyde dehydrogenase family protein [Ruegeria arenilitoris]|uniref:aldehyde dehydrogenase family protein n=1 Tax=Ruegeria arenilitoris TaxID=1173585 RepID=UPI0020C3061A|nr:aldehyde dehydrogenase family protein [Ruegeria arenilitoris]